MHIYLKFGAAGYFALWLCECSNFEQEIFSRVCCVCWWSFLPVQRRTLSGSSLSAWAAFPAQFRRCRFRKRHFLACLSNGPRKFFYYLHRKSPKVGVPYHLVGRNKILVGEEPSYFEPNFFFYQARCRKHGINERSEKGEENKHKQKSHKRGEPNETNHEPMKRSEEIELRK